MSMRVYRTGNKKNKVQKWQMLNMFEFERDILRIVKGTKYEVRESNENNSKVQRYPQFGNKFYLPRGTKKISEPDWLILTKCLSENKKEHIYLWDSREMKLSIIQQSRNGSQIRIRITGADCVYEFTIARERSQLQGKSNNW